ncbi:MAG: four helix bundle protein [Chitinophagaceae bacterium]|nr:four helix bundle protein [Chitinophagaceae bacterium]
MLAEQMKKNAIVHLTFQFSLLAIEYCQQLEKGQKYIIARQLLKSSTGIGANVMEAQNAESKSDFIHKMKIAAKEASETLYWLLLCRESNGFPPVGTLIEKVEEINKILGRILISSKRSENT